MSEDQLNAFISKVKSDESLQKVRQEEGADVVAIAKEVGFSITNAETIEASVQPNALKHWRNFVELYVF